MNLAQPFGSDMSALDRFSAIGVGVPCKSPMPLKDTPVGVGGPSDPVVMMDEVVVTVVTRHEDGMMMEKVVVEKNLTGDVRMANKPMIMPVDHHGHLWMGVEVHSISDNDVGYLGVVIPIARIKVDERGMAGMGFHPGVVGRHQPNGPRVGVQPHSSSEVLFVLFRVLLDVFSQCAIFVSQFRWL